MPVYYSRKQFYHYSVIDWLEGDTDISSAPQSRLQGRNSDWKHFFARDVISMPDKWEYPWFATWDTAFHMIPFAHLDPDFACEQLLLFTREWFLHPNGQMPSYEWDFGDVNPPVHAWACWRVYKMTGPKGDRDINFFEALLSQTDAQLYVVGQSQGSKRQEYLYRRLLGLDNISVFDRSQDLPNGWIYAPS